jgi:N6-L-threonylcarbamoyladenine synthase
VVPELASRDHIRRVLPLARSVLDDAGARLARHRPRRFTQGPGLAGALLVGAGSRLCAGRLRAASGRSASTTSRAICCRLPVGRSAGVPFVALLVSGGHTQLMRVDDVGSYELLGETIDDAAGEAFDKSAKLLGLGYPGGRRWRGWPSSAIARTVRRCRGPLLHSANLDFSFAGLKTAVRTQMHKLGSNVCEQDQAHLAASTQQAIVDVLVRKSVARVKETGCKRLVVAGGVGANVRLRDS